MPNYVANVVKMKGIAHLPLFSTEDGKKCFDFNKIIPMPESLNIESGSRTEQAIVYYLTNRCLIPLGCLDEDVRKIIANTVTNMFSKNWAQEVFIRTSEWAYKARPYEQDKLYSDGEKYVNNYKNYGATTWYDWCTANWGTKWNAGSNIEIDNSTISFQTAWAMPEPVITKLSQMYPDKEVKIWWADEDRGSNTGHAVYKNGQIISGGPNKNSSNEAYEMYDYCWNINRQ